MFVSRKYLSDLIRVNSSFRDILWNLCGLKHKYVEIYIDASQVALEEYVYTQHERKHKHNTKRRTNSLSNAYNMNIRVHLFVRQSILYNIK